MSFGREFPNIPRPNMERSHRQPRTNFSYIMDAKSFLLLYLSLFGVPLSSTPPLLPLSRALADTIRKANHVVFIEKQMSPTSADKEKMSSIRKT